MATINQILNKIKDMAARTGLFAIGKNEFFDTLTDMTNKMSEINDNVNSVAKSLVWQDPVVNIVGTLPSSGLTIGQRYILTTDKKIYTATSATAFDGGTIPEAGWAAKNQADGYIYSYNGAGWKNTGLTAFPEEVVLSSAQVLTDVQKTQARGNIAAFATGDVVGVLGTGETKVINQKTTTISNIKAWAIAESFSISNPTFDFYGNISSGVITWPDGDIGSISNVVIVANRITSIRYNRSDGKYATVNIVYSSSGNVSSQQVLLTGF